MGCQARERLSHFKGAGSFGYQWDVAFWLIFVESQIGQLEFEVRCAERMIRERVSDS
jgi:hypothetical protein